MLPPGRHRYRHHGYGRLQCPPGRCAGWDCVRKQRGNSTTLEVKLPSPVTWTEYTRLHTLLSSNTLLETSICLPILSHSYNLPGPKELLCTRGENWNISHASQSELLQFQVLRKVPKQFEFMAITGSIPLPLSFSPSSKFRQRRNRIPLQIKQ